MFKQTELVEVSERDGGIQINVKFKALFKSIMFYFMLIVCGILAMMLLTLQVAFWVKVIIVLVVVLPPLFIALNLLRRINYSEQTRISKRTINQTIKSHGFVIGRKNSSIRAVLRVNKSQDSLHTSSEPKIPVFEISEIQTNFQPRYCAISDKGKEIYFGYGLDYLSTDKLESLLIKYNLLG